MLGAGVSSVGVKRIAVSGFGERIERIVGNGLHASCAASCWITGADCGPPIAMCAARGGLAMICCGRAGMVCWACRRDKRDDVWVARRSCGA